MKSLIGSILLFVGLVMPYYAQSQEGDLPTIEQFRAINLQMLEDAYDGINADSARSMRLVSIAQHLNNDSLLAIAYNYLGFYFDSYKGDNSSAFEYYYKALEHASKGTDKRRISSIYFDIGVSYLDLKNHEEAFRNTKEGYLNLPDTAHPRYYWMLIQYYNNLGAIHVQKQNADSILHYANEALDINKIINSSNMEFNSLTNNAGAYSMMGDYAKADEFFEKAQELIRSNSMNQAKLGFNTLYLPHLIKQAKYDEAEQLAKSLVVEHQTTQNRHLALLGAKYLRIVYDEKEMTDSAYVYARMESDLNSEIYNQANLNKIQALKIGQSLREVEIQNQEKLYESKLRTNILLGSSFTLVLLAGLLFWNGRNSRKAKTKIEKAYSELEATQTQLIHSEKMASLGELTAGIAHEIQNPLNFVNNFSDVSNELVAELKEELGNGDIDEAKLLSNDVADNLQKINHHGQRASEIVKGMLEHSRTGDGKKEPTDINKLADEYLRLAYHGIRAKDKAFNADFALDLDENLPKIKVVPQDIGRVLLNLINNAFQAVKESENPKVVVRSKMLKDQVEISVSDNGPGIPENIRDKVFQPFFTTKANGEGTGLGLSMSYDIITKGHGGDLRMINQGRGAEFIIILPV